MFLVEHLEFISVPTLVGIYFYHLLVQYLMRLQYEELEINESQKAEMTYTEINGRQALFSTHLLLSCGTPCTPGRPECPPATSMHGFELKALHLEWNLGSLMPCIHFLWDFPELSTQNKYLLTGFSFFCCFLFLK